MTKEEMRNQRKPFHIRCPHCGTDMEYDSGSIEREISQTKAELAEIHRQIAVYKSEYRADFNHNKWFKNAQIAYAAKAKRLTELKLQRKVGNELLYRSKLQLFAQIVKDKVGLKQYAEWMQQAEEDMIFQTSELAQNKNSEILGKSSTALNRY